MCKVEIPEKYRKYNCPPTIYVDGKTCHMIGSSSRAIYEYDKDTVVKLSWSGDDGQNFAEVCKYDELSQEDHLVRHMAKTWGYEEFQTDYQTHLYDVFSVVFQERLVAGYYDAGDFESITDESIELDRLISLFDEYEVGDLGYSQFMRDENGVWKIHDLGISYS